MGLNQHIQLRGTVRFGAVASMLLLLSTLLLVHHQPTVQVILPEDE
jgi:hypothetical protein